MNYRNLALLFLGSGLFYLSALSGCSLSTTEVVGCKNNAECREIFGMGSVCAADFFCEQMSLNPRCEKTYPEELLTDEAVFASHYVVGSIEERSRGIFRAFEQSIELAYREANNSRKIKGKDIGVVFCNVDSGTDGLSEKDAVVDTGQYLVDLGVVAIIGPAKSSTVTELYQAINGDNEGKVPADMLMVTPSATADSLSNLDNANPSDANPGNLWRTTPPDTAQAEAIAIDMRSIEHGRAAVVDSVAIIYEQGDYGDGLADKFTTIFTQKAGQVIKSLRFTDPTQRDSAIRTIAADPNIQEVLFVSSNIKDTVKFLTLAAELAGFTNKGIFLTDAADTSDVLTKAPATRFANVRGSRPAPTGGVLYNKFLSSYQVQFGEDAADFAFTANAYDAAWLVAYAIAWAVHNPVETKATFSGHSLARGLRQISTVTAPAVAVGVSDFGTAISRFKSGLPIDVSGASGRLDYNAFEETSGPIEIWEINGTSSVGIWQVDL